MRISRGEHTIPEEEAVPIVGGGIFPNGDNGHHNLEAYTPETLLENGFSVKSITDNDTELWSKMGQLRTRVYVGERQFLTPNCVDSNGCEFDEYDKYSEHFVATDANEDVIGTIRIIHRPEGGKLPCEDIFGIDLPCSREVSRIMADSSIERRLQPLVTLSLLRAAVKVAPKDEDEAYAIIEPGLYRYIDEVIGIKLDKLTEPRHIEEYNSTNFVVAMYPHQMTSQIYERDKKKRPIRGLPEKIAPFFEQHASSAGLGRVALDTVNKPSPEQFDRNLGFISEAEHEHLQSSTVAIAGAGGDGGELAITLAQLGVGKFRIADPEEFEVNNLNRQAGATYETIGQNKAEVIAEMIRDVNPYAEVQVYTEGVTPDNIESFVMGANLVVDETEYTHPELGVMIARTARKHKLPDLVTLNIGFGSYTTSFSPDGKTFESYMGLDEDASLEEVAKQTVSISKWVPHIPSYADINNFTKVAEQEVPTPSVSPGVKLAAGVASVQAIAHLLKDITPQRAGWIDFAPRGKSVDAIDGVHEVKFPRIHFIKTLAVAALRTKLGMNPPAGY
jgi:molybdopterin/thiamine biosynthesis adenylyltransferase/N-acyl-L-homoserine lactone synthetase